jgi:hypothetical protein
MRRLAVQLIFRIDRSSLGEADGSLGRLRPYHRRGARPQPAHHDRDVSCAHGQGRPNVRARLARLDGEIGLRDSDHSRRRPASECTGALENRRNLPAARISLVGTLR